MVKAVIAIYLHNYCALTKIVFKMFPSLSFNNCYTFMVALGIVRTMFVSGAADRVSVCGVGLLGRGRRLAHHLPRTHAHIKNTIQSKSEIICLFCSMWNHLVCNLHRKVSKTRSDLNAYIETCNTISFLCSAPHCNMLASVSDHSGANFSCQSFKFGMCNLQYYVYNWNKFDKW